MVVEKAWQMYSQVSVLIMEMSNKPMLSSASSRYQIIGNFKCQPIHEMVRHNALLFFSFVIFFQCKAKVPCFTSKGASMDLCTSRIYLPDGTLKANWPYTVNHEAEL